MLDRILDATRERVVDLRARRATVMARAEAMPSPPSFREALSGLSHLGVIAEIKRRSPSRGRLAVDLDVPALASRYAEGGAVALSVLTEPAFFDGDPADLGAAQQASGLPVLRKDFILESLQVWEARAMGASAVLLIAAALTPNEMLGLLDDVEHAGLDAMVEVHNPEEAGIALDLGARIVGVNNRDLGSFTVDLVVAEAMAAQLEMAPLKVAESGIFTSADALRMKAAGYDAVLVGEALVKSDDPTRLIRELSV